VRKTQKKNLEPTDSVAKTAEVMHFYLFIFSSTGHEFEYRRNQRQTPAMATNMQYSLHHSTASLEMSNQALDDFSSNFSF